MDKIINIPKGYSFAGKNLVEVISHDSLQSRIKNIGQEVSQYYKNKIPIIIGVLNGAFLFMADLVRNLDIEFEVDFIKIDSYGDDTKSSGTVRLIKDISADITNRHVIIVEDIVVLGGCIAPTHGWITSNKTFLVAVTVLRPAHSPVAEAVSEFCAVIV